MTGGRALPVDPHLGTGSERAVWSALREQLEPDEILLSGIRFTDPRNGDVEADFIVLMPSLGAAVIEVKGGQVSLDNGEWVTSNGRTARRIHPVEQARRAKHALRRYLDRQPEWDRPLLRTEWLLALPLTDVTGDLGPEARRDLVIGRNDLAQAMPMVRAAVAASVNRDPVPSGDWAETALTLLLRSVGTPEPKRASRRPGMLRWLALAALVVANVAVAAAVTWALGPAALAVAAAACMALSGLGWWLYTHRAAAARGLLVGVAASVAGLAIGGAAVAMALGSDDGPAPVSAGVSAGVSALPSATGACSPNYQPCLPVVDDLDCGEIRAKVTVIGDDVYDLDRDGDKVACESFAQ